MTTPADIQAAYGFVGAMARAIPELNTILQQAVREQWTTDRFTMTVTDSAWWRQNANAARQWLTSATVDPATHENRWNAQAGNVLKRAEALGVPMTWAQARDASMWRALNEGVDEENFDGYLVRTFFAQGTQPAGRAAAITMELGEIGAAYGYKPSDAESQLWLRRVLGGETTMDTFRAQALSYAKAKYPSLIAELDAGQTVQQIAQPRRERMAQLLELDPSDVDLSDALIDRSLQARGQDGKPVTMPVWEFEKEVRKDQRWQYTNNAKASVGSMLERIGKDWGFSS